MKKLHFFKRIAKTQYQADHFRHPVYAMIRDLCSDKFEWVDTDEDADAVLVPTFPLYTGKKPWFIFIEDWVTLYDPEIINGKTGGVDVKSTAKHAELKVLFSQPNFQGIICHHRGTFGDLLWLGLTPKLFYLPLGLPRRTRTPVGYLREFQFLFTNSWMAGYNNFRNRSGELVLRAFRELWQEGREDLRLRICCQLPPNGDLEQGLMEFVRSCPGIQIIEHHATDEEVHHAVQNSDCLLLPSHRLHVHSVLLPMSYGVPVIASDGWGLHEYIIDGITGFQVRGIYGVTSWHDNVMREDYSQWPRTIRVVPQLKERMLAFADDRSHANHFGRQAYEYVNDVHAVDRHKRVFEEILATAVGMA